MSKHLVFQDVVLIHLLVVLNKIINAVTNRLHDELLSHGA